MQMNEIETKEISVYREQVSEFEAKAQDLKITNEDELKVAVEMSVELKEFGSKIKKLKESITKPANEILKNARSFFNPVEDKYDNALKVTNQKIIDYSEKVRLAGEKKENKIAEKVDAGEMTAEAAEKKLDKIKTVENTVVADNGGVQFRTVRKVRIVNVHLLPAIYLMPNEVAIRRDALGGTVIPGVEVFEERTLANIKG